MERTTAMSRSWRRITIGSRWASSRIAPRRFFASVAGTLFIWTYHDDWSNRLGVIETQQEMARAGAAEHEIGAFPTAWHSAWPRSARGVKSLDAVFGHPFSNARVLAAS